MFSLTISFGPAATMWTLMWRDKEKAEAAYAQLTRGQGITAADEFGQTANISASEIHGAMLEDMELSKLAHIERALHQARMQAQGQQAAESDAVLRTQRFKQGPAVLVPGMNGGGFPQR